MDEVCEWFGWVMDELKFWFKMLVEFVENFVFFVNVCFLEFMFKVKKFLDDDIKFVFCVFLDDLCGIDEWNVVEFEKVIW